MTDHRTCLTPCGAPITTSRSVRLYTYVTNHPQNHKRTLQNLLQGYAQSSHRTRLLHDTYPAMVLTMHIRHLNFSSPAALVSVSSSRILLFNASSTWLRVWASPLIPATDPVSSEGDVSATSDSCWLELANDMGSSFTSTSAALPLFCDVGIPPSGLYPQEQIAM